MYPYDWEIENAEEVVPDALVSVACTGMFGTYARIAVLKEADDGSYFAATKSDFEALYSSIEGMSEVKVMDLSDMVLDGQPARKVTTVCTNDFGARLVLIDYFYIWHSYVYLVECCVEEVNYDSYESKFDAIMDSYTIKAAFSTLSQEESSGSAAPDRVEDAYYIGDIVSMSQTSSSGEIGYYDITMTDWGTYVPSYAGYTPEYADTYVYVTFEITNTGNRDISISDYDFNIYVNNYVVDTGYGENRLSATLAPGRQASGNVYIKMNPEDVNGLEVELGDVIFRISDNRLQTGRSSDHGSNRFSSSGFGKGLVSDRSGVLFL